jgi:hypothetical protein
MGAYLHKFNLLGQITSRQYKQIATLQASMKIVIEAVDTSAQDHTELVSLALDEQLSIFEHRADSTIGAILTLHHNKLPIHYFNIDQLEQLFDGVNRTAHNEGFHPMPKQISDLFQIEASLFKAKSRYNYYFTCSMFQCTKFTNHSQITTIPYPPAKSINPP